ncbi:unnamed protein product [Hapterophycus canaliculatus]
MLPPGQGADTCWQPSPAPCGGVYPAQLPRTQAPRFRQQHRSGKPSILCYRTRESCVGNFRGSVSSGEVGEAPSWQKCVEQQRVVPREETILVAAQTWYGYGRSDDDPRTCTDPMCPICWEGGEETLQNDQIACSRFEHGVSSKVSSGLGRLKGGDVRAATISGPTPRA